MAGRSSSGGIDYQRLGRGGICVRFVHQGAQPTAHWQAQALAQFNILVAETLAVWPVSHDDFLAAARMAGQHATGLRAGGALHLAVAANRGAPLVSLDRGQVEAGTALGVVTALL